jgi:nucleoside 2-deoxyribosyltransferase
MTNDPCPLCDSANVTWFPPTPDHNKWECPNCGRVLFARMALRMFKMDQGSHPHLAAILSHAAWRRQRSDEWPAMFRPEDVERLAREGTLLNPAEQAENFLLWLGHSTTPGFAIEINYGHASARIGALSKAGCEFILRSLEEQKLVQGVFSPGRASSVTLSFSGWQRFHELTRRSSKGAGAFMAMDFNQPDLATMFQECFKPAALRAGFNLFRLDEEPKAGLIDERLRVEIRRCLFLVADLSHRNSGAYWEAGFAEGLGKPVIYMCEESIFKNKGTHFDTNHLHTVVWNASDPTKAANDLTATIRNTLPDEAKMSDD